MWQSVPLSDASAFLSEFDADSLDFGAIARTTYRTSGATKGSKLIDQSKPRFSVNAVDDYPSYGEFVNKMGINGGWTMGSVTATCIQTNDLNCQYRAYMWSWPGDSGSPVFKWDAVNDSDYVTLTGINWGFHSGEQEALFSPFGGIDQDIGPLYVYPGHAPPPLQASIDTGPTTLPGYVECTWAASASGGTPPYSFSWSGVASGTGSNLTDFITSSGSLSVTVTDDGGYTDTDSWNITRDDNAPLPPNCYWEE